MSGNVMVRRIGRGLTLATAGLLLAPMPARAQTPVATAVLYEVNEALRFLKGRRPTTDPEEFRQRLAQASLLGKEVRTEVQDPFFSAGTFIKSDAVSNVDLRTGRGPVSGTFSLLADLDASRESIDTLMVTGSGWLRGELDLTTAMQGFAKLSGRWGVQKMKRGGALTGLFLIPFRNPYNPADEGYYYADLGLDGPGTLCGSGFGLCPLRDDEFSLGIPLTKLLVGLYE